MGDGGSGDGGSGDGGAGADCYDRGDHEGGHVVHIKSDGAACLSNWMASHVTSAATWELIPSNQIAFVVHIVHNLN